MNEIPKGPEQTLEQKIKKLTFEIDDFLERKALATDPDALQALATMIIMKRKELAQYEAERVIQNASRKP